MEKKDQNPESSSCHCILAGGEAFGKILVGIAAVLAAFNSPEIAKNFSQNQSQSQNQCQNTTINNNHFIREATERVVDSVEKFGAAKAIEIIPKKAEINSKWPRGFFILPQYQEPLKLELENADTRKRKENIILEYWNKSVNTPSKAEVDEIK